MYTSVEKVLDSIKGVCSITKDGAEVVNEKALRGENIDTLVYNSVFNPEDGVRDICRWIIRECAQVLDIVPASIHDLYMARAAGHYSGMTVPAINIRGLTYDTARAVFRAAIDNDTAAFIFEIAKSEIGYTFQRPAEYSAVILSAALKEGYKGPVFIQGDHFQFNLKRYKESPGRETEEIKKITAEAVCAGFYNIDIDSSTLVDLDEKDARDEQRNNFTAAADMTEFIRERQPEGVTVSIGGEIGEVGGRNSTPEDLRAFMDGYRELLGRKNPESFCGLSKISVQTGTSHGGVVLPDGSIAKVNLDFDTLRKLSEIARTKYGMGGAVQHGASTLPADAFHKFPQTETLEVHLATEFQNMVYEHPSFPAGLKEEIYAYLKKEFQSERKPEQTDEQFIYKTRKKGFGPFKKKMWDMPAEARENIRNTLKDKFVFLFKKLNTAGRNGLIREYIKPVKVHVPPPEVVQQG